MAVYVVVVVVLVVLLVASFRALSGGEELTEEDFRRVLVSLTDFTSARSAELALALTGPPPPGDAANPAAEVAAAARKKLAGYQQQLARFGRAADPLGSAQALLSAAIEGLGWACRMVEPGTYWDHPGIQDAVAVLSRHSNRCLDEVTARLAVPGGPGP